MDDAAILETLFLDDMLHDVVVLVRVDTEIRLCLSTELNDAVEYAVNVGITGNTMDDVIG